jgi:hypothetical protein
VLLAPLDDVEDDLAQPARPAHFVGNWSVNMRHEAFQPLAVERSLEVEPGDL